jgi:hypothetical protein
MDVLGPGRLRPRAHWGGTIEDLCDELPRRVGDSEFTTLIDDQGFAEAIYRDALADGIMDRVRYRSWRFWALRAIPRS